MVLLQILILLRECVQVYVVLPTSSPHPAWWHGRPFPDAALPPYRPQRSSRTPGASCGSSELRPLSVRRTCMASPIICANRVASRHREIFDSGQERFHGEARLENIKRKAERVPQIWISDLGQQLIPDK